MAKVKVELEDTLQFKEFAASCGEPMRMSGKIIPGADLKLGCGEGTTAETNFRGEQEFKVGVGAVWACRGRGMLFEGTVKKSVVSTYSVGSTVVGIASPETKLLVSNVSNQEDLDYFRTAFDEAEAQNLLQ